MLFKLSLYLHILAGTIGLVIGPIAMYAPKRKGLHTKFGVTYFYLMALVCLSAAMLSVLNWEKSWWFLIVAIFSFSFAWKGYHAVKRRGDNWVRKHISGMLGSYIAMTTALLIVNITSIPGHQAIPKIVFWLLPTIIATPFIARTIKKHT